MQTLIFLHFPYSLVLVHTLLKIFKILTTVTLQCTTVTLECRYIQKNKKMLYIFCFLNFLLKNRKIGKYLRKNNLIGNHSRSIKSFVDDVVFHVIVENLIVYTFQQFIHRQIADSILHFLVDFELFQRTLQILFHQHL